MNQPISSLNLPDYKISELRCLGYQYVGDVELAKTSFSAPEWSQLTRAPETKTALDIYQEECLLGSILSLNKNLDDVLQGGVPLGLITEFCGEPGSGKTQLCFQLCASVQLPKWCGGLDGKAVFIGTNFGFASHRLKEVAADYVRKYEAIPGKPAQGAFNVEHIMENVYYIQIGSSYVELIAVVNHLKEWLETRSSIRLVIIDSISAPLKVLKGSEQNKVIYSVLADLQNLAQKYKFAVVLTNDLTTRKIGPKESSQEPSLGGSYFHRINIRIALRKSTSGFKFTVVKSLNSDSTQEYDLFT